MAIGMTYDEYWYGDPLMVRAFYEANKIRKRIVNETAWIHGAYICRALDATVGNMFRSKTDTPAEYPPKPIEDEPEQKISEDQEALYAQAYMTNMVLVGKGWGKHKEVRECK